MGFGSKGIAALTSVVMLMLGALVLPAPAAADIALNDELTEADGSTTILGGGEHFFVKFGEDAAFGIVWGTEDVENNVYFVAIKARYLGLAQVYDADGNVLESDYSLKVYTMYAVKLDSIVEFDDIDDNGVLQYQRAYNEDDSEFTTYAGPEPTPKKVDLRTAWTASDVEATEGDNGKSWNFELTAKNLAYTMLEENATPDAGDGILNSLTLSFNLEANVVQVDNATLPQWRITVTTGPLDMMTFLYPERLDDMQIAGDVIQYDVKWDQEIDGWDFDPANENPMLLIEMQNIVGNWMSKLMAKWMDMRMLSYMNAVGVMACESTEGALEINETTGDLPTVKRLTATQLTFGSDWTRIGLLTWVDDAMVDGEPAEVKAQVMAGHRVLAYGVGETRFEGFVTLTGLAFPGGGLIVHDPTFSVDALVNISIGQAEEMPTVLLGIAAVIVIIVVVAIAVVAAGRGKPKQGVKNGYEKSPASRPGEWEKYYNKKP
ncbi:MAG TPA: hypothetical protein VMW71_02685 [Thermoplasmata archaeon]|nr:hypothetical protein [Thermoplasmata archaeon]